MQVGGRARERSRKKRIKGRGDFDLSRLRSSLTLDPAHTAFKQQQQQRIHPDHLNSMANHDQVDPRRLVRLEAERVANVSPVLPACKRTKAADTRPRPPAPSLSLSPHFAHFARPRFARVRTRSVALTSQHITRAKTIRGTSASSRA